MTKAQEATASVASSGTATLTVRIIRNLPDLEAIGEDWDNLACHVCRRSPVTSYSWVISHLEENGQGAGSWRCLAAFDEDRLIGVWPLGMRREPVLGKQVVHLGQPGERRVHSVDAVIWPGREAEVLKVFGRCLDEIAPDWFGLDERWVDDRSPLVQSSTPPFSGCTVIRHAVGVTAVIPTVGEWSAYASRLNGKFRRGLKRFHRKLMEKAEVKAEFLSGDQAGPEHLERFLRLEACGWKGAAGSAVAEQPHMKRLYCVLANRLHRSGMLEWHFLQVGGQDIAGHLAIRSGRTLYLHRIGYDEEWACYSPGVLLMEQMIVRAFEDAETDEINFFTLRTWLGAWRPETRPYYHLWIYPRRPRSLIAGAWPRQIVQELRKVRAVRALSRMIRGEVIEGSPIQSRGDFLRRQGGGAKE